MEFGTMGKCRMTEWKEFSESFSSFDIRHSDFDVQPSTSYQTNCSTMKQKASAIWNGSLKEGKGSISTGSGVLSSVPYSFRMRFEDEKGTNPEELIAAAHAGCFSMAF